MIELDPKILKQAENAENRQALKAILQENHIDVSNWEFNELAGMLEIPHGYNCPCCMAMFYPLRFQNQNRTQNETIQKNSFQEW